jgi:prepilin-type N-terminal cleavage/methylation domain-containing protein/prepilin-type processing-associated H-X9-DG protein
MHITRPQSRHGFSLIELLVVIAIVAVLIATLMPAISAAKEVAQTAVCGSNMRQITIGIDNYATDSATRYPYGTWRPGYNITAANPVVTYDILIDTYIGGKGFDAADSGTWQNQNPKKLKSLICPKDPFLGNSGIAPRSYAMTPAISGGDFLFSLTDVGYPPPSIKQSQVKDPAGTFMLGEMPANAAQGRGRQGGGSCAAPWLQSGALTYLVNPSYVVLGNPPYTIFTAHPLGCGTHPNDTFNYAYADGHIQNFFPLDTDPRAAGGGAPRAGMRGFGTGPTGYYWYNSVCTSGAWVLIH